MPLKLKNIVTIILLFKKKRKIKKLFSSLLNFQQTNMADGVEECSDVFASHVFNGTANRQHETSVSVLQPEPHYKVSLACGSADYSKNYENQPDVLECPADSKSEMRSGHEEVLEIVIPHEQEDKSQEEQIEQEREVSPESLARPGTERTFLQDDEEDDVGEKNDKVYKSMLKKVGTIKRPCNKEKVPDLGVTQLVSFGWQIAKGMVRFSAILINVYLY